MQVTCKECGKHYRIDNKLIDGKQVRFKCKKCLGSIWVDGTQRRFKNPDVSDYAPLMVESGLVAHPKQPVNESETEKIGSKDWFNIPIPLPNMHSLRTKIVLLFFLAPMAMLSISILLSVRIIDDLNAKASREGSQIVNGLAEQIIESKANSVAAQVKLYLDSHPRLNTQEFNTHKTFKQLAVQKVGKTGYTALYSLPDKKGVWRTWAHVNPKIIGINMRKLAKPLGNNFPGFWKIYSSVKKGKDSKGYYTWQDADGQFREKFMVCTNVPGTNFVIAATTYLEEFNQPIVNLNQRTDAIAATAKKIFFSIMIAGALLGAMIVFVYGYKITSRIQTLTDLAERISVGELGTRIDLSARDELGDLAKAIARMQASIRLAIERLRFRKQRPAA
ncbi:MAG: HAMP domain-containing protein [Desulfobacterales bacterium]|nr:HAMP domain-containing protein [Desulfobacterales bacterium]